MVCLFVCLIDGVSCHFQQYFSSSIVAVSFIDGGNWRTLRKPPIMYLSYNHRNRSPRKQLLCVCNNMEVDSSTQIKKGGLSFRFMVFNATFNNISAISCRLVLLVEETRGPGENHQPVVSHWQTLSHFRSGKSLQFI